MMAAASSRKASHRGPRRRRKLGLFSEQLLFVCYKYDLVRRSEEGRPGVVDCIKMFAVITGKWKDASKLRERRNESEYLRFVLFFCLGRRARECTSCGTTRDSPSNGGFSLMNGAVNWSWQIYDLICMRSNTRRNNSQVVFLQVEEIVLNFLFTFSSEFEMRNPFPEWLCVIFKETHSTESACWKRKTIMQ